MRRLHRGACARCRAARRNGGGGRRGVGRGRAHEWWTGDGVGAARAGRVHGVCRPGRCVMSRYRRRSLGDAFGYLPGEQPADADGWLKLNTNESPLPPSPRVAEAVAGAAAALSRYPSPHAEPLRSLLAERHGVAAEQVFVANGADQVLDCCYRAYAEPGDAVVHATPTYSLFRVLAQVFSVRDVAVPLRPDGALRTGFAAEDAPLRFVVNPNSPTGQWVAPQELEGQLEGAAGVVVIDEAYADFAPASALSRLRHHANWVVVRSLSKSFALAWLRFGYAVALRDLLR